MSKNNRMRRAADSLPPFPKFRKDGKIMYDVNGGMVMEDHFKVIKGLIYSADTTYIAEKNVTNYMKKVRSYDISMKRMEMKAEKMVRRRQFIHTLTLWVPVGILLGLAVYFTLTR